VTIEENFRFDTRIRDRMLKKGLVSQEEVDARLAALPDREEEATRVEVEQPSGSSDEGTGQ
jgi:hypothetical protein